MPWNSTWPIGSTSVKANRIQGQQNTTYIETTMGNSIVGTNTNATRDHFWNVGTNEDGRHRFVQSPAFTVGGNPADAVIGTGMDSVLYAKTTNGRVEWFSRNAQVIYQWLPSYITGTVTISGNGSGDWKNVTSVPANVYGEMFMYKNTDKSLIQSGAFSSNASVVRAYSNRIKVTDESDDYLIQYRNDGVGTLMIQARRGVFGSGLDGVWTYVITYRAQ